MTANSQLLKPHLKPKQKQTKQTTRIGTDSQKEITWRVASVEGEREENGGKVQGIKSYKIARGRLRIVCEMEKPKNLYVHPMDMS